MDIASLVTILSTGVSAISVLEKGYDIVTGTTMNRRLDRFSAEVTSQLDEIRNGIYRLPVQEVYDTGHSVQRTVDDVLEIGSAVQPMQHALGGDVAVSNPILSPDRFRDAFRENPEHVLHSIRPLSGAALPDDFLDDPTLRPVIFEKRGQYLIGLIKVGYARDMLHLDYRPLGADSVSHVLPPPASLIPSLAFDWVTIPAGEFTMGSDKLRDRLAFDNEQPQHIVFVPEFRIARVPVTVAQFRAFVNETNYRTTAEDQGSAYGYTGSRWEDIEGAAWQHPRGLGSDVTSKSDHPVTCVSWLDALAFCEWAGVRLPSEAQWEKAARGTDGRIWPWGNEEPDTGRCNFNVHVGDTTSVGQYENGASFYRVLDMAGNVWEWTSSQWKDYPYRAGDGREIEDAASRRVVRGGSFGGVPLNVRCAYRNGGTPDHRGNYGGFRVVSPGL